MAGQARFDYMDLDLDLEFGLGLTTGLCSFHNSSGGHIERLRSADELGVG